MNDESPYQSLCGWRGIDDLQRAFASHFPTLAQSAPHLMEGPAPTDPVLLYKAWRDVLGNDPAYPAQQIGDCVSFGHGHGNDLLQCIEISLGEPAVFQETDTEFIYGTSREVGHILGRQDGSYGAAGGEGHDHDRHGQSQDAGIRRHLLRPAGQGVGTVRCTGGRQERGRSVQARAMPRTSPPGTSWSRPCGTATRSRSARARASRSTRDAQGFCQARGSWGHCMFIAGVRFDRPGACIIQSWGPDTPSGPLALDQPSFSFWADQSVINRILGEGDSWALSKSPAFQNARPTSGVEVPRRGVSGLGGTPPRP